MTDLLPVVMADDALTPDEGRQWVGEAWLRGVEAVWETGRRLRELKDGRLHGEWLPFVESLPWFGERTARALMQIEAHPVLGNRQYIADLPHEWGTLAVLAPLTESEARAAVDRGDIKPNMSQADAKVAVDKARGLEPDLQDDWYTPRWLFDQLGVTFDIDVCAPQAEVLRTVPARRYYTVELDGLAQPWHGLIWCNPPYSAPAPWIERWAEHPDGLILTHASVKSDRMPRLWHAADALVLFAGMQFTRPNGDVATPYWMLQLAARGDAATAALSNLDTTRKWMGPVMRRG